MAEKSGAPDTADRVADIVEAALDLDRTAWPEFLNINCGDNRRLRTEVESLLGYHQQAAQLIETPAVAANAEFFADEHYALSVGQVIANYRVLSFIGEGGMGEVYLAGDLSLGRRVALKLVKRGVGTRDLVRHFRQEERILAGLEHPNIARLYGGSVTEDGVPYFVMEYVAGDRLDEFCEAARLSIPDRLQLFRKICSAVAYAHQHLVIHRDLKPANIRVNEEGEPKLLDFGIAKLLDPDAAGGAQNTMTLAAVMTPEYASPEQVRGETITTASDVYSLGVVLYELLTGRKPYRLTSHTAVEISRAITEQDPPRPSTVAADTGKTKIDNRKSLHGDLDNIVLMALRKEPQRRYSSVAQFSDDIRRYLEGRAVLAHKDTLGYRARKFVQRNRIAVAATAVLLLAILAGSVATAWQAKRAREQARIAAHERDRAERRFADVRQLSNDLLFEIAPLIERVQGSTAARQALVTRSLRYLDSLAQESGGDPQLQSELAAAYEKIGELQGSPRKPNLNDLDGAVASYGKARAIREQLFNTSHNAVQLKHVAFDLSTLAVLQWLRNDLRASLQASEAALQVFSQLLHDDPQSEELRIANAEAQIDLGRTHYYNEQLAKVYDPIHAALATLEELQQRNPANIDIQRLLSRAHTFLGITLSWDGKQAEGEAEMAKAIALGESLLAQDPHDNVLRQGLTETYMQGAQILEEVDDNRAFANAAKARDLARTSSEADPADIQARQNLAKANSVIGIISVRLKKQDEAIGYLETSARIFAELAKNDPSRRTYRHDQGRVWMALGNAQREAEHFEAALTAYNTAIGIFEELARSDPGSNFQLRKLPTAYTYRGEVHSAWAATLPEAEKEAHLKAANEDYRRAFEFYRQLEADHALSDYDRKQMEELRNALTP